MIRHFRRSSLKSRPKFLQRERDMTVCIAAMYEIGRGSNSGIVLVTDFQETDSKTNVKAERAIKMWILSDHIAVLGADDMVKFHDLMGRMDEVISLLPKDHVLTVGDAVDLYRSVEDDWKQEYIERNVLFRYGVSWDSLAERMAANELPQAFLDNLFSSVNACQIPFLTDVIFAGWNPDGTPKIISVTPESIDDRSHYGFATIGEGYEIADNEFKTGIYLPKIRKSAAVFKAIVAKRRAEAVASVGRMTSVWVIEPGSGCVRLGHHLLQELEKLYDDMQEERVKKEFDYYGQAEKVLETDEQERESRRPKRKSRRGSSNVA